MIQVLPGVTNKKVQHLKQRIAKLVSISERINNGEAPEKMLHFLIGEDMEILDKTPVQFHAIAPANGPGQCCGHWAKKNCNPLSMNLARPKSTAIFAMCPACLMKIN